MLWEPVENKHQMIMNESHYNKPIDCGYGIKRFYTHLPPRWWSASKFTLFYLFILTLATHSSPKSLNLPLNSLLLLWLYWMLQPVFTLVTLHMYSKCQPSTMHFLMSHPQSWLLTNSTGEGDQIYKNIDMQKKKKSKHNTNTGNGTED